MSLRMLTVVVDCAEPRRQASFWAAALGYDVRERNTDEFLVSDPAHAAAPLYFMRVPEPKVGKNRLHLDVKIRTTWKTPTPGRCLRTPGAE